ncbi:uncharacterized protein I206_103973 [Kwoniella pini CBS 10737]|uniref:Origin recognition complex subunit 5 C-terminal domain-containing protein n=1 Tax=Kwoniella pini CBS 10737 TaxID=1296096 RepID=A0A1B9I300_9TREE|nr:uncharacterized protein I206_04453 [Kwoniella pini CBS 10737]OCF49922.1 hypothetical protein I206_04453 [Kwoniella pini CBS 10737]
MTKTILDTTLSNPPYPSLVYLHHPHHSSTSLEFPLNSNSNTKYARIDTIEYNTPKLFFSGILNKLSDEKDGIEVQSFDGFAVRLRGWHNSQAHNSVKEKGKGKAKINGNGHINGHSNGSASLHEETEDLSIAIVITKAERLRLVLGNGWSVITRLNELLGVPISVVLCSSVPWDNVRPMRGDAPEPVHIYLPPPTREEIISILISASPHPLWSRFLDLLLSTTLSLCYPSIEEISYLAEALWPIYTSKLNPHFSMIHLNQSYPDPLNPPKELEINLKLLTDLKYQLSLSLTSSIENLLPRQIGLNEFKKSFLPSNSTSTFDFVIGNNNGIGKNLPKLPNIELNNIENFLLVASYCASYNPPKSDIKLFGRSSGPIGKRKKGGGFRRAGYGRVRIGKVPQRLLGPKPFSIDRLLALFSSLYAEHSPRPEDLQIAFGNEEENFSSSGSESNEEENQKGVIIKLNLNENEIEKQNQRKRKKEYQRELKWDKHVEELTMNIKLWNLISNLEFKGFLKRISPIDRLDNIMIRCEVDYEFIKELSKELKLILDEYLYESIM